MRPPLDAPPGLCAAQIERAMACMRDQPGLDLSLAQLAAETDLSPRQFARAFRQTTGETPDRWMRRQRIEQAKTMMRGTGLSLSQVAELCGFVSPAHFSRVFMSLAGVSPSVWRQQVRH